MRGVKQKDVHDRPAIGVPTKVGSARAGRSGCSGGIDRNFAAGEPLLQDLERRRIQRAPLAWRTWPRQPARQQHGERKHRGPQQKSMRAASQIGAQSQAPCHTPLSRYVWLSASKHGRTAGQQHDEPHHERIHPVPPASERWGRFMGSSRPGAAQLLQRAVRSQ